MMDLKHSSSSWKFFLGVLIPILFSLSARGQTADFTIPDQVCLTETLAIEDLSNLITNYTWDFCHEELNNVDTVDPFLVLTANSIQTLKYAYDSGNWYGFVGNRLGNELIRLDFGPSLENSAPGIVSLGDFGKASFFPNAIDFAKEGDTWYGLVVDQFGEIIRLRFDDGLSNPPVSDNMGDLSSWIDVWEIDIEYDNDNTRWIAAVADANASKYTMIDFGASLGNSPVNVVDLGTAEPDISLPRGIDLIHTSSGWFMIISDLGSDKVLLASFGSDPFSEPSYSTLFEPTNPTKVRIAREGNSYRAFLLSNSGLYRMDFGNDLAIFNGETLLGTFGGIITANYIAMDLVRASPSWYLLSAHNTTEQLIRINFSSDCSSDISLDESSDPQPNIQYTTSEDYIVELTGYDQFGNPFIHEDTVTVLNQTAPSISFTSENVCISSLIHFTPSNTGLTLYEWDFDGDDIIDVSDATGAVQSFDYSGLGTGTYTVRLDVSDGTCNNFYEQVITIYPDPPTPTFVAGTSEECTNTLISFTNTTDESLHPGIMMYKWDFDSDGIIDSTDPNPSYAYTTPGVKTVVLVDSIPGCSATSATFDITINPGPTPSFFAASVCQDEAMQFTNTSTGADSYLWDFGDGFTSTNENPSHIFAAAGNYNVTLTATDLDGCDASVIVEVAVSDSPQIDFDFNIPCTSVDGTQFFDLSTVDNADLVTWTWFVDDVEVSTQQSPTIVFNNEGIKTIRLDVQSSNGCESSYSEDIEVLSAPTPDFSISIGCQGEASSFMDSTPSSGNPIVSWLWTVNGVNYGTQDIDHVFNEAGSFDVTLEVTGQNFCPESITKTIEIIELPTVAFNVQGACDNQLIRATDMSTNSADPVIAQRWMLNGDNVGNGSQLVLEQLSDDTYDLTLELETQSGCVISSSQSLVINNAPNSSFTSSRTYGIPNDQLSFTNTSTGATTNQWLLDGVLLSTDEQTEHISFTEVGTYTVSLVAQNSLGCNDTTDQQILIAVPEVDLAIGTFELVSENNVGRIFLEVQNRSNLPVEIVEAQIVLENTFAITEQILGFIDVGGTNLVSLNVGIPLTVSEPSYFCVRLISQYVDYPDMEPVNNEKCITINPIVQLEDPFPNPVQDQFRLKLIVGEEGSASVSVVNSAGKVEINSIESVSQGLNNFFIDMSLLNPGIYYVTVEVQGTTHKKKVIKL